MGMAVLIYAALMLLPSGTDALASHFGIEGSVNSPSKGFVFIVPCFILAALNHGDVVLIDAKTDSTNQERFVSNQGGGKVWDA